MTGMMMKISPPLPFSPLGSSFMLQYLEANQIFFCARHRHPSPRASDFLVFVHVHNGRLGSCDGVMTRPRQQHKGTCAEIQPLHCSGRDGSFCSVQRSSKRPQSDVRRGGSTDAVEEKSTHTVPLFLLRYELHVRTNPDSPICTLCQTNQCVCIHTHIR